MHRRNADYSLEQTARVFQADAQNSKWLDKRRLRRNAPIFPGVRALGNEHSSPLKGQCDDAAVRRARVENSCLLGRPGFERNAPDLWPRSQL